MILKGEFKANYMIRKGEHMERRFIEEHFPIKEIGIESTREKQIRHGHLSTLHIWWARRPLASSRSSCYASLIITPKSKQEIIKKTKFLIELSQWENSQNQSMVKTAKNEIYKNNQNLPPKVLDPFSGGGSIPLELQRLGCDTYAMDYNPVAVLILKCALEFPQKYNQNGKENALLTSDNESDLFKKIKKWSDYVRDETYKETHMFYPNEENKSRAVGYIWARTIPCQNPSCKAEIPLMLQYWLSKKKNRETALFPYVENKRIEFKLVGKGFEKFPNGFNPSKGSISKAIATCQICNSNIDPKTLKKLFDGKKDSRRIIAAVIIGNKKTGKNFRLVNRNDEIICNAIEKTIDIEVNTLKQIWNLNPIPDEKMPTEAVFGIRAHKYGMSEFGDIFNSRQKFVLIIFVKKIREAYEKMINEGYDKEYARAITTYLAIILDMVAVSCNTLCRWESTRELIADMFARQVIPMTWDYIELNPFSGSSGSWDIVTKYLEKYIKHASLIPNPGTVSQNTATKLPFETNFFDAVFTDPPYYDNIAYSYLSDFFYVWLKRSIGYLYPELFSTPLTPKSDEIVAYRNKGDAGKSKLLFERNLKKSFSEIYRVLKPEGIAVIVYAHKSTDGWETLINSLLDSGLVVTAAWPINTEMKSRLRTRESAALASSIYMIVRKLQKEPIGFYKDVKKQLKEYLNKKLEQLWNEGIIGADFFMSSIGSAIEVYGKYEKIVDDTDNSVPVLKLLNDTRKIVTDYTINKVIRGEFSSEISNMTKFYILWRWAYGEAKVPFDDARKMAQSIGIDIEHEWNKGFIIKDKEFIRVLGPDERKEIDDSHDLIDVLHQTLSLWKNGKRKQMDELLNSKNYKNSQVFRRVSKAISQSLPLGSTEKNWLDGYLMSSESNDFQNGVQSKLF